MIRNRNYKYIDEALKKLKSVNKKSDVNYKVVKILDFFSIIETEKVECLLKCGIIKNNDIYTEAGL